MNILLFTGAGFGVPLKLPVTTEFENILANASPDLSKQLRTYLGKKNKDIEHVLSTLETFVNTKNFHSSVIQTNSDEGSGYFQNVKDVFENYKQSAIKLIHEIKSSLYEILIQFEPLDATNLYSNLISQLQSLGRKQDLVALSIFTTNYDLTFEASDDETDSFSSNGIKEVNYGFRNRASKLRFTKDFDYEWNPEIIEYKKLHGSLDWAMNGNVCIKSGVTYTPARPQDMPMLFPGYKDTPTIEPFKTFHDHLLQRLLSADLVIVVGFAFRDPYINNIFDTAIKISKDASFFCYNPLDIKDFPTESAIKQLNSYSNFSHIQEGAVLDKNVINIAEIKKHLTTKI